MLLFKIIVRLWPVSYNELFSLFNRLKGKCYNFCDSKGEISINPKRGNSRIFTNRILFNGIVLSKSDFLGVRKSKRTNGIILQPGTIIYPS